MLDEGALVGRHFRVVGEDRVLQGMLVDEALEEELLVGGARLLVGLGDRQHQLDHQEESGHLNRIAQADQYVKDSLKHEFSP